eukprot:Nk52_evm17s156 gene=Nk52_evmTU17s156
MKGLMEDQVGEGGGQSECKGDGDPCKGDGDPCVGGGVEEEEGDSEKEEEEEETEVYTGSKDTDGLPHGRGTIITTRKRKREIEEEEEEEEEEEVFHGRFRHGVKSGVGRYIFSDGSTLKGTFVGDVLHGRGVYTYLDGTKMEGNYEEGALTGEALTVAVGESGEGEVVVSRGIYVENIPQRIWARSGGEEVNGGGAFEGGVDKEGKHHGWGCMYTYPDGEHVLVGKWNHGEMEIGYFGKKAEAEEDGIRKGAKHVLKIHLCDLGVDLLYDRKEMIFISRLDQLMKEDLGTRTYKFDESDSKRISSDPHLRDPYESLHVEVKPSNIKGANEGLFAKRSIRPHQVCVFYNGIRITHKEVDERDWIYNDNTISLNEDTVIDVPHAFSMEDQYCSTLGHKANHCSSSPNAMYDAIFHPRFGEIKCIRALEDEIQAGEEILVDYGYSHDTLPNWYQQEKEKEKEEDNKKHDVPERLACNRKKFGSFNIIVDCLSSGDPRDASFNYESRVRAAGNVILKGPYLTLGGSIFDWAKALLKLLSGASAFGSERELFWVRFPDSQGELSQLVKMADGDGKLKLFMTGCCRQSR